MQNKALKHHVMSYQHIYVYVVSLIFINRKSCTFIHILKKTSLVDWIVWFLKIWLCVKLKKKLYKNVYTTVMFPQNCPKKHPNFFQNLYCLKMLP